MDLDLEAVRHLLRHLGSIAKLRQNGRVRDWLDRQDAAPHVVQARLRETVSSVLDATLAALGPRDAARAARWKAIVHGCDLRGDLQKIVADRLGICKRHLQRERRAAHEAIAARVLHELTTAPAAQTPLLDLSYEMEMQIEYAAALKSFGRFDEASRILELVMDSACNPLLRIQAIVDRLDVYVREADAGTRRRLAGTARAIAKTVPSSGEIESELLVAELYAFDARNGAAFVRHIERTLQHLRASGATPRNSELGVRASLLLAKHYADTGAVADAEDYLATARSFIERCPVIVPSLLIRVRAAEGDIRLIRAGPGKAREDFREALTIACRQQAPYEMARISYFLAQACYQGGDLQEAERQTRNARTLAGQLELNWSTIGPAAEALLAAVYLERGEAQSALTWSTFAGAHPMRDERWRNVFSITTAEALDRLGQCDDALKTIDRSCNGLARDGSWSFLGIGECVRAQLYAHAQRPIEAQAAIARSLDILERYGMIASLARAYDVSARIIGNVRHYTRARELKDYLSH